MSPDSVDPELPLCWARTLVDDARPFVINSRATPVTYAPLLQDRVDLTLNPLVSLNRAATFGVEIDAENGADLARPYEILARLFLSEPILLRSGRPGHVHVLVSVYDKTDLRTRLEQQVRTDRALARPITQLTAVRLPGSQKSPASPPYQLADPLVSWDDALAALRRPLPGDHLVWTGDLAKFRHSKRSGMLMAIYVDLRRRGYTGDQIFQLRKEPGFAKLLEKVTTRSPAAVESWHLRHVEKAETWLARPQVRQILLRRMTQRLREPIRGRTGLVDRFVELAHYHAAILANSDRALYDVSVRQLAVWAGVSRETAWTATRRLITQLRIGRVSPPRNRGTTLYVLPVSKAEQMTQLGTASSLDSWCDLDVPNQVDSPLLTLMGADAFRIRSGIGKGPLWLFANLDPASPRACHRRNEARWISHLDRLGMVIETPEGGWLRGPVDLVEIAGRLGVAGRGAAQQAQFQRERLSWRAYRRERRAS
jgi:hypothetical protein